MNIELRDQATERGDTIAFADTHDGNVEAIRTTLQRRDSISNSTSGIIVPVELNTNLWITFSAESDKPLNLSRCGNTNGVGQTNALHSCLNDSVKDGQQVNQVAAKGILSGKAHVAPSRSDESNQRYSIGEKLVDAAAMAVGTELC